ncbi:conserved transmembrane protein [Babesia caballi]|uniref:Conserved transmembrane protein n=1 Tax=Babesia caballi TaxID=5871 RepID=A0AAV4LWD1_BABCB|nr:conserved transmembrane protein [Babesia caballi]
MATTESRADAANYYDPEKNATGDHYCFAETTPTYIRHEFVKKVFGIVTLQLIATFAFVLTAYNVERIANFFLANRWIGIAAVVVFMVVSLVVACKRSLAHNSTVAICILALMTLCMSVYVSAFAVRFAPFEITVAAGLTAGLTFCITLFAMQTKYDFTGFIMYLFCISLGMMFAGVLIAFFPSKAARIAYSAIAATLICVYLVVDIQLAVGGKRLEWTVDDYVIAAVSIYADIITLFIEILNLVGSSNS